MLRRVCVCVSVCLYVCVHLCLCVSLHMHIYAFLELNSLLRGVHVFTQEVPCFKFISTLNTFIDKIEF